MIGKVRIPPFPRWTGMTATIGGPSEESYHGGGLRSVESLVSFRLTRRARLWARWRMLTGRWPR